MLRRRGVVADPVSAGVTWPWEDTFTTAGTPTVLETGQAWVNDSPSGQTWTKASGALTGSADGAILITNLGTPSPQVVEVEMGGTVGAASAVTILISFDPTQATNSEWQYRIFFNSDGSLKISKRTPGATTVFTSATGLWTPGTALRVVKESVGATNVFTFLIDGVQVATYTDAGATRPNATWVGLRFAGSGGLTYNFASFRARTTI